MAVPQPAIVDASTPIAPAFSVAWTLPQPTISEIIVTGGPYTAQLPLSIGDPVGTPSASGGTEPYTWSIVSQVQA